MTVLKNHLGLAPELEAAIDELVMLLAGVAGYERGEVIEVAVEVRGDRTAFRIGLNGPKAKFELRVEKPDHAETQAKRAAEEAYRDDRFSERACDRCGKPYRGPAVYCSLACAEADA